MGRYYKTSDSQQLDFMYQLPQQLMVQAIQTADAANDQIYNQSDLLGNTLAKINHLVPDNQRVGQIQDEYNSQIDAVTKDLMKDPANYRKQMPLVRQLTRDITSNMQTGEIAGIMSNAGKLAEWEKTYQPLVAKGDITPDAYQSMRTKFLSDYDKSGGYKYNSATKTGNLLQTEDIYKTQDFNKILKDNIGTIKSNAKATKTDSISGNQMWLVSNGNKDEWVTAARVAQIATDTLLGDQNVLGYLKQGGKYGYLKGVSDENGDFINPYTLNKEGNPVFNDKSILTPSIRSIVGQEAFRKTESESSRKVNDYMKQQIDFNNDVSKIKLNDNLHDQNFKDEAAIKWIYDEKAIRLRDALSESDKDSAEAAVKKLASIQHRVVASPDGQITTKPFGGDKKLTSADIQLSLTDDKAKVIENIKLAQDPNLSPNQRDHYQQLADQAQQRLNNNSQYAEKAKNYAFTQMKKDAGMTDEDIAKLDNWPLLRDKYQKQLDATRGSKGINISGIGSGIRDFDGTAALSKSEYDVVTKLTSKLREGDRIQRTFDKYNSKWFNDNSENTSYKTEGVGLSADQKWWIYTQLQANPEGFTIHDTHTDRLNTNKGEKDDWEGMLKEGALNSHTIDVININNPVPGLGTTITFKAKDADGNVTGQPLVMTIPNNLQSTLANSLSKGKNDNQKKLAKMLNDKVEVDFLSSIKNKVNDSVSGDVVQPAGFYSHYDAANDYTAQIKVVPQSDRTNPKGQPVSYKTYISLKNGGWSELPLPLKKADGTTIFTSEFSNEEAIAKAFSSYIKQ